jgi:glutamine amidotransferase
MITIIDYGMGNLRSVQKALEFLGTSATITSDLTKIKKAKKLVLPGVGAFGKAMENIHKLGLADMLKKSTGQGTPLLGICLGMQLLMSTSEEHGSREGLGLVKGSVDFFRNANGFATDLTVPQMGWNYVKQTKKNLLFNGLPNEFQVYFVHSYYVNPEDNKVVIGKTNYGIDFCSALQQNNIFGVQYHPEKSGEVGLHILKNFIAI